MYDSSTDQLLPRKAVNGTQQAPCLFLVFDREGLREAYYARARQDKRFEHLVACGSSGPAHGSQASNSGCASRSVMLIDGLCPTQSIRRLIKEHQLIGGVLLTDALHGYQEDQPKLGPFRVGKVELSVLDFGTSWSEISSALLQAPDGRHPTSQSLRPDEADERAMGYDQSRLDSDLALFASLTRREQQVLAGIGAAKTPSQIAQELQIAVSTVENHKSRLMKKIDVHKSIELVRFAIRVGAAPV